MTLLLVGNRVCINILKGFLSDRHSTSRTSLSDKPKFLQPSHFPPCRVLTRAIDGFYLGKVAFLIKKKIIAVYSLKYYADFSDLQVLNKSQLPGYLRKDTMNVSHYLRTN